MTTIKEVVEMWNKKYSNTKNKASEITQGCFFGKLGAEATIKLSDKYLCEPWNKRTCYVFTFNSDKKTKILEKIEISFQRRTNENSDAQKFYELLKEIIIDNSNFTVSRGRINPNYLVLKRAFRLDSSAKDICDGMKELIDLTQNKICKFLAGGGGGGDEKPLTESEKKIFLKIMKKHGIKKNENKDLCAKCLKIYIQTLEILDKLYIKRIYNKKVLKVSYYTQKSVAQKLLIASKDENKYGEFRLYYTNGMNDPHEGKTLLQFLEIENEDLELPETLPFIACFSLEADSLNQFRLYGKDNNEEATGVSIAFDFDFFDNGTNKEQEKYRLYRCVYIDTHEGKISLSFSKKEEEEDEEEEEIKPNQLEVEELFKDLKEKIQDLKKELKINDINKTELVKDLLIKIRYLVKDDAFMEERECRIIDWKNKKDKSINIDGDRLYIEIGGINNYVDEIYFAPLTEGMEVFEIETGIKCIRSRRPYKPKR